MELSSESIKSTAIWILILEKAIKEIQRFLLIKKKEESNLT